jgi:hypothetical protein
MFGMYPDLGQARLAFRPEDGIAETTAEEGAE